MKKMVSAVCLALVGFSSAAFGSGRACVEQCKMSARDFREECQVRYQQCLNDGADVGSNACRLQWDSCIEDSNSGFSFCVDQCSSSDFPIFPAK